MCELEYIVSFITIIYIHVANEGRHIRIGF